MRIALAFAALLASIVVLGGCKKTLHWKAIEDDLHTRIAENVPGAGAIDVTCPETGVEKGLAFRCHVTTSQEDFEVEVTLRDLAGSYSMEPVR